ncbi:MAG: MFS transporter [Bacteroidia bacterium]|jgi:UMF1 family MFS transporter|nr:MFS transporter [Bacteroidia bacterium]
MLQKGDPKIIRAWTFYDWANSVYPLVISSAVFPIFYEAVTTKRDANENLISDMVSWAGFEFHNTSFLSYVVALSYLIVALASPVLSGIADYSGNKKRFLQFFCFLGAFSSSMLCLFNPDHIGWSMTALLFASIGYWGSLVFYNAYLPEIAEQSDHDKVSARGFAMGYIGSSILLITILVLLKTPAIPSFVTDKPNFQAKDGFLLVGIWWIGFALFTFRRLPNNVYNRKVEGNVLVKGYSELMKVFRDVLTRKQLRRFLGSYFMYNMGVQTVMIMAVPFATKAIKWESKEHMQTSLIISILLIQFLGVAGSFLMSFLSRKIGNLKTLGLVILMWVGVCTMVFAIVDMPVEFYITAACVGLVMGGIQAISRSTYSKMLPETQDHASYFSFFDVSEKIGLAIGTTTFGLIEDATGGIRNSVLSLIITFIIGFLLLLRVPKSETVR